MFQDVKQQVRFFMSFDLTRLINDHIFQIVACYMELYNNTLDPEIQKNIVQQVLFLMIFLIG